MEMEITLSVSFGYESNDEIRKLLEDFRDMVNFCIDKALQNKATSFAKLRKLVYSEWKTRWIIQHTFAIQLAELQHQC